MDVVACLRFTLDHFIFYFLTMADVANAPVVANASPTTSPVDRGPDSPAALAANAASEDIDILAELGKLSKIPSSLRSIAPFLEESYGILL